jgi:hypothetical protein
MPIPPEIEARQAEIRELVAKIPAMAQRQDSTFTQLEDLHAVAVKLGMYDAADWLKPHLDRIRARISS